MRQHGTAVGLFLCPERIIMPVKSYTDQNGKRKYYAAFYYTDYNGQRRKKKKEGFTTAAAAKQFEKDFIDQHNGSSDILFKNLVENYLADCRQRLKPNTVYSKKSILDNFVTPFFSDLPVSDITTLHVRQWQNTLLPQGKKQTYCRIIHAQLAAVLNYAVRYYGLKQNPARLAGSIGTLKQQKAIQFYTLDQFRQFLPCVKEKYRLAFKILFFTGLRVGEMLALTVSDFDPEAGTLDINKTLAEHFNIVQPPKTPKSKRLVTLPAFLIRDIQDYINCRFYNPQPGERLFFWLKRPAFAWEKRRAAQQAGLPNIRIHDFRHSHASLLINMGFPPLVVSERLGHENVKTTLDIYSHLYPEKAASVADRLDQFKM